MNEKMRLIQTGIRTDYLLDEVLSQPENFWSMHYKDVKNKILPLTVPVVYADDDGKLTDSILNSTSDICTPQYFKMPKTVNWLRMNGYQHHTWAGFFRLPPGGVVPWHTDDRGKYYEKKRRYHLCIQGKYVYQVEGEPDLVVEPGMLFWFDLFALHRAESIGDKDRITLLFDLPETETIINP